MTFTPRGDRFDGSVVGEFFSNVADDDGSTLNVLRLENNADILRIERRTIERDPIIANERGSEYENLATVRGIGHRFSV
jgi:hypothetical protein